MSKHDSPEVLFPPPMMFAGAVGLGVAIDGNVLDWRHAMHVSQFAGIVASLLGIGVVAVTLGLFRRNRTRPEPWQPASTLIDAGIYRHSRNPMYLGMALIAAGIALFFESIAAGILLAVTLVVIDRYVVAREEAYLVRRFGQPYEDYRNRVRRWLMPSLPSRLAPPRECAS